MIENRPLTVLDSLNRGLHQAFAEDPRVLLLGEDVLDPYGGAFKVTRGLSQVYPARVFTTPISEAGITGVATGMALRGLRPVVEIMFGDFVTLAADQIINHMTKFRWMYNEQVSVPLVIRTPMGGRRGYGPTHSQTLEKLFLGTPGLVVLAPTTLGDPGKLLSDTIQNTTDPVLFIENKLLYLLPVLTEASLTDFDIRLTSTLHASTFTLSIKDAPRPVLTIAAYGYMAELARQALLKLAYEEEIFAELIAPEQLAPFETGAIEASIRKTGRLLVVEEGGLTMGWGAEILARMVEAPGLHLSAAHRLAAQDSPVPASGPLEAAVLPSVDDILRSARKIM